MAYKTEADKRDQHIMETFRNASMQYQAGDYEGALYWLDGLKVMIETTQKEKSRNEHINKN